MSENSIPSNQIVNDPARIILRVKETLSKLRFGSILFHKTEKNKDGTVLHARVNGSIKTWKTRPYEFKVPMKHGLRECFYIDQNNWMEWEID